MQALAITTLGSGPPLVLVHGGAGPRTTWRGLEPLTAHWTLHYVHRRGYGDSPPPPNGRQDFDVDAADLDPLFRTHRPHVMAHSYGVLGTLIAATRTPGSLRSLTLIEPPLYYLAPADPAVARIEALGTEVLTRGRDADPAMLREFLTLAGAPPAETLELSEPALRRATGARLPSEAHPDLEPLRKARIPSLVASGAHSPALETICDNLAEALDAHRLRTPGAGHFVPAAPGFATALHHFLTESDTPPGTAAR
ncbi:alpha/beta hydrolase [Nocardia sp. NPDC005978]|uniref:alpha/beta fold hydrolase n=1 Tax=Nocardia sp. NPDC005978 TaxID=3156725 RepID=UPI0033ABB349